MEKTKPDNIPMIVGAFTNNAWAIMPEKLKMIIEVLDNRVAGIMFDGAEIEARVGRRATRFSGIKGNIALISLFGIISQRMNMVSASSGGTSTEMFSQVFNRTIADKSIGAVVIDTDSPGGSVAGIQELSDLIYNARGTKPIISVVNSLMASAAFWIGSSADEIVMTPSGQIGSVGVVATHVDQSAANEQLGRKITIIKAGKYKAESNPFEPLTDDAAANMQNEVDSYYSDFVDALARNRDTTAKRVQDGFGQGRMVRANEAIAAGMADRVGTLDQVVEQLAPKGKSIALARAEFDVREIN
jgi:signal peptide peptidase SppA